MLKLKTHIMRILSLSGGHMTSSSDSDFITTLFVEIHANDHYIEFVGMDAHSKYHSFVDLFKRVLGLDYEGIKVHITVKDGGSAILIERV